MLTLTEAAGAYLAQMLEDENVPEGVSVRFVFEDDGLTLQPDEPRAGDASFEYDGRTVLLLDEEVAELLGDQTLDVEADAEGPRLLLRQSDADEDDEDDEYDDADEG